MVLDLDRIKVSISQIFVIYFSRRNVTLYHAHRLCCILAKSNKCVHLIADRARRADVPLFLPTQICFLLKVIFLNDVSECALDLDALRQNI